MSNEENQNQAVENTALPEAPKSALNNIISTLMGLKAKNPIVFFGAVGGLVVLLIIIMLSGGDSKTVSGPVIKNLAVGQQYVLKSANSYDKDATVRLVAVPGTISAYDDTEEADRNGACQHIPQGTPVTVLELQDAYGKKNAYSKVQIEEGECKGNSGWALSIDVQ